MSQIILEFEKSQMKESIPEFNVGDTIVVTTMIVEGKKKRPQKFEGTVTERKGVLSRASVTVRKVIDQIGVEKTFALHSPLLIDLQVTKRGKVRRGRLFYLRDRVGAKANRIKAAN
ncbi:MAG: 50S ribosomal protein L19 [Candidatus Margulisiibacteriota bacterium]